MLKARGGKNGTLQAGQRKARFRRAFVFSFQMSLVSRSIFYNRLILRATSCRRSRLRRYLLKGKIVAI